MGSDSKTFGMMMLFFLTLLSYAPLKSELVLIAGDETLTNNGIVMLNSIFGVIWMLFAVMWLGLAVKYAIE